MASTIQARSRHFGIIDSAPGSTLARERARCGMVRVAKTISEGRSPRCVCTRIGVRFFECVAPAVCANRPISIEECRRICAEFPPERDTAALARFLRQIRAPRYHGRISPRRHARGERVFESNCASCHSPRGRSRHVLSNDEINPLDDEPFNFNRTNACRALTTNWEGGHVWAEFSSPVYKPRIAAGDRGYRTMPLVGIWATSPFMHNQSIGIRASPTASPRERGRAFEISIHEHRDPNRSPRVQRLPIAVGPFPAGTPLAFVFNRDPVTGDVLCDDIIENRGYQYGANLSEDDKAALIESFAHQQRSAGLSDLVVLGLLRMDWQTPLVIAIELVALVLLTNRFFWRGRVSWSARNAR